MTDAWPKLAQWAVLGGVGIGLLVLGYQGVRSPSRPVRIFLAAWMLAIRSIPSIPRAALGVVLMIGIGAGAQLAFSAYPGLDNKTLATASLVWQAVMAMMVATLAVFLHLLLIHRGLPMTSEELRDPYLAGGERIDASAPKAALWLIIQAALLGLLIWVVSMGMRVLSNLFLFLAVERAAPLSAFLEPRMVGLSIVASASFIAFLATLLFCLVRPALSLRERNPLGTGLIVAIRNTPGLLVLWALLLIPPSVLSGLAAALPALVFGGERIAVITSGALLLVFGVVQVLVVEAATLIFANRAIALRRAQEAPDPTRSADHVAKVYHIGARRPRASMGEAGV